MNTLILFAALAAGQPAPATFHSPAPTAAKGDVKAGPPLVHAFDLFNGTGGTVTILKVEAGCGCLRQGLSATVLAPGEKTKLALEVNTLTQPDGPNRWQAVVAYKLEVPNAEAKTGELLLQITATLTREIAVNPPQLAFSTTGEASHTLTVTDKRAKPLTVLKASSSVAHLTAEIAPAANAEGVRTQRVTVKLSAAAPAGHKDEVITLLTDDLECPELRIPVRVLKRTAAAVSVTPEAVSARFASGQTEVSTLVQLRSADGKPISI
ncbi:MAG: DUF1573 domain-containing protein, partial [Gemmataceae bacterium]|nr:DUF1573 domain-containing protein [Gemmataceae bacterium]